MVRTKFSQPLSGKERYYMKKKSTVCVRDRGFHKMQTPTGKREHVLQGVPGIMALMK